MGASSVTCISRVLALGPTAARLSLDNSTHGNAMSTDGWMTKWSFAIHRRCISCCGMVVPSRNRLPR